MAEYTGVPEATPELQAPDDYQRVQASPRAFGEGLAEGAESLGQGVIKASEFYGQVAADNATNNYLQEATNLLHGDPSKQVMGPDGQMVPDTGYFGLRGANAMEAREETSQRLNEIAQEQAENIKDPVARLRFESESRRYRAQFDTQIGTHADTEQRTWATDTNNTTYQLALASAARQADNPVAAAAAQEQARQAATKNAQLSGIDPAGARLKADQDVTLARIRALIVNNPEAAQSVFDKDGSVLAGMPNYDQVSRQIKGAVINSEMAPATDAFVADALEHAQSRIGVAGAPTTQDVAAAIGQQEWNGKGPAPTSVNGAVGSSQIKPSTAVQYGLAPDAATAARELRDPKIATQWKQAIIDKISALPNVQGDPARIAVGYFSGEGNIAPEGSPTPYIHDYKDGTGKTTSSYVADIAGRMEKFPSTADALAANMDTTLTRARAFAEQKWPQYPDEQERFVTGIQRQLEQKITQQHQMYEVDLHTIQQVMASPNPPISQDELLARGPQIAQAWTNVQTNLPYSAMGVERMFDANAKGKALTFGVDFKDYLDRALAPHDDPQRLGQAQLATVGVGSGADAPLTNTGVTQLSTLLGLRGTPQGEAAAAQIKAFSDQAYGTLTYSNREAGVYDKRGEEAYGRFMAQALPIMAKAAQGGNLSSVLNPKSPDYLGNLMQTFARTPAQTVHDRLTAEGIRENQVFQEGLPAQSSLVMAIKMGTVTPEEGLWIGRKLGFIPAGETTSAAPKAQKPFDPLAKFRQPPQSGPGAATPGG